MKFYCKEISITDGEFGLTLTLSEEEDIGTAQMNMTTEEIMNSSGQYLLLQKSYSEDESERDYYYIESNYYEKSRELQNFSIDLYRNQVILRYDDELFEIGINAKDQEFKNLKKALKKFTITKGQLRIHE